MGDSEYASPLGSGKVSIELTQTPSLPENSEPVDTPSNNDTWSADFSQQD